MTDKHFHQVTIAGFDTGRLSCYGGDKFPTEEAARLHSVEILEEHRKDHSHPGECPLDAAIRELRERTEINAFFYGAYGFVMVECGEETEEGCQEFFLADVLPSIAAEYYSHPSTRIPSSVLHRMMGVVSQARPESDDDRPGMYL